MHSVTPTVYLLAKTHLDPQNVRAWLSAIGAPDYHLPDVSPAANLVILAGKRCYLSFEPGLNPNVTRVRNDCAEFITHILDAKHGSLLEHVTFTFGIEGISRICTAELNRHRPGVAISEQSGRFCRYTDLPYIVPPSIQDAPTDSPTLRDQKVRSRALFAQAFAQMEANYRELAAIWDIDNLPTFAAKKTLTSLLRRIIGLGVASGGVWSFNLRALRHVLTVRGTPAAEEEIVHVCSLILNVMLATEPLFFADFTRTDDGFWTPQYVKV